jgi:uncharacterized protein (DUF1501 family)
MGARPTRRGVLAGLGALGAAAGLAGSRVAFARAPGDARLVLVFLRGGLDGLAAVPPAGDPGLAALRGAPEEGLLPLTGGFALHPSLAPLAPLYERGQLLALHAVGLPYRGRSHFEAQDLLEGGGGTPRAERSGWLNRALAALGAGEGVGMALGPQVPLLLRGEAAVGSLDPGGASEAAETLLERVAELYAADEVLGAMLEEGLRAREMAGAAMGGRALRGRAEARAAQACARLLADPLGPRVMTVSASGWDTHSNQSGRLERGLAQLGAALASLPGHMGQEVWARTAVLVVTEFGRTAPLNGTGGTDHGTGGAALLLGGAVAGGRVVADWPGLGAGDLLEGRDLRPTTDLRAVFKGVLEAHLGVDRRALDEEVFPDSAGITPLRGLIA